MPERVLEIPGIIARGTWALRPAHVVGTLVLEEHAATLAEESGAPYEIAPYAAFTDATWAGETLTLYRHDDILAISGSRELNRAWGVVVERACILPEMTRGLRSLGTSRGGHAQLQTRFFGPLLHARRRLQEPDALEWRVTHFDARALSDRLAATIRELAMERFPESPPDRRALEAELGEALEPLAGNLEALADAAERIRSDPDGQRFVTWREWTRQMRRVFLEADRAWASMADSLRQVPEK
jgi:hypothetical protein